MELWIRSRDKNFIVKITNGIYINKCHENGHINGYEITGGHGGPLGIYSEKRALEILDEIQNMLIKNQPSVFTYTDGNIVNIDGNLVYEMPEE